jgi:hypothetical protein
MALGFPQDSVVHWVLFTNQLEETSDKSLLSWGSLGLVCFDCRYFGLAHGSKVVQDLYTTLPKYYISVNF